MRRFALFLLFLSFLPLSAHAQQGLIISPKRVVFEEGQRIIEVLLANRGNKEKKYRISVINRAMQPNGQLIEATEPAEGESFAKGFVRLSPRQTTLGPKQTQKIRIMSRLGASAQDGEYRSHLLVQEIPDASAAENAAGESDDGLGINVQAIFGISIPVILRKGELTAQTSLSNPKIVTTDGETYLQVRVNRTGGKSIIGTARVLSGVNQIGLLKNVAVYMSSPYRIVSIKLDPERAKNLSGKNLRIAYGAVEENEDAPDAELTFKVP